MKFKFLIILILSLIITNFAYSHNHYPITRNSESDILKGKVLYNQYCASCHKANLAGATDWKGLDKDGHRKAPPLNGTGHTWHHDDKTLHAIIKYGLAKLVNNYEGKMIGFGNKLSDKEIDSILAYIKSFWSEEHYEYQLKLN